MESRTANRHVDASEERPAFCILSSREEDGNRIKDLLVTGREDGPEVAGVYRQIADVDRNWPVVVTNLEDYTAEERGQIIERARRSDLAPVYFVTQDSIEIGFPRLLAEGILPNLFTGSLHRGTRSALWPSIRRLSSDTPFGLHQYFGPDVVLRQMTLHTSDRRIQALDSLDEYAAALGVPGRLRMMLRTAADEFLTNAFYNAPVAPDGTRPFARLERTAVLGRDQVRPANIAFCCEGGTVGLAVTDQYGSLSNQETFDSLVRAFGRGPGQVRQEGGGAGLGLYLSLTSVSHMAITIEPGKRTEMVVLLDAARGFRSAMSGHRSFNIFTRTSA